MVSWLRQQRRVLGGYGSTQVTALSPHYIGLKQPCVLYHLSAVQFYFGNLVSVDAAVSHLQATMMVYQAVAEYSTRAREEETKEYDLFVEVQLPGRLPSKYWFKRHNYHMTRILKVRTSRRYNAF